MTACTIFGKFFKSHWSYNHFWHCLLPFFSCSKSGYNSKSKGLENHEIYADSSIHSEMCTSSCLGCGSANWLLWFSAESNRSPEIFQHLGSRLEERVILLLCHCSLYDTKCLSCYTFLRSLLKEDHGAFKYVPYYCSYVVGSGKIWIRLPLNHMFALYCFLPLNCMFVLCSQSFMWGEACMRIYFHCWSKKIIVLINMLCFNVLIGVNFENNVCYVSTVFFFFLSKMNLHG